jgi:hypothetical protein
LGIFFARLSRLVVFRGLGRVFCLGGLVVPVTWGEEKERRARESRVDVDRFASFLRARENAKTGKKQ